MISIVFIWLGNITGCGRQAAEQPLNNTGIKDKNVAAVNVNAQDSTAAKNLSEQDLALLPPDIRAIRERGRLVVAMYRQDRPPFFYVDKKGNLAGIDIDLAEDIAENLGVKPVFDRSAGSFDEVVNQVVRGQADLGISKLSITLPRAQKASFTQPYVCFHQALLVNRLKLAAITKNRQSDADSLTMIVKSSQKIGVLADTSYIEYAHTLCPNAQVIAFPNIDKLIAAARSGKILAAFYDENALKTEVDQTPDLLVYTKMFILKDRIDQIAIAVAPENTHLLSWLDTYLEIMKQDQVIEQIVEQSSKGVK